MKIRKKLVLSFLMVIVLPMSVLAVATTRMINSSMEESMQEAINQNLKAALIQFYVRGDQMKFGMLQAASEDEVQKAVAEKNAQYLKKLMSAWKEYRPYVDLWAVVDGEGKVIARLNSALSGDALSLNGVVAAAVDSKTAIISTELLSAEVLDREIGTAAEGMLLTVATPVIRDGRVTGAIITGDLLNGDSFVSDALEEKIPGLLVSIAQGDSVISTNMRYEGDRRNPKLAGEVMGRINSGLSFNGDAVIEAKPYKVAAEPIRDNKGKVIGALFVGVPKERFIALKFSSMRAIALATALGVFFAGGIAVLAARELSKPITQLADATRKIQKGDFNIRIVEKRLESRDEIGELANSFEAMARKLKQSHEELERIVDERTKELLLLQKVNNMLNSGATLGEILETIASGLTSVFRYDICAIHILNEERTHLLCKGYSADSQFVKKVEELSGVKVVNYPIPLFEGSMLTRLIKTKEPIMTADIAALVKSHTDNSALQALAPLIARLSGIRFGVGVPLLAGDKIVGVIGIGSSRELSGKDIERLFNFSKQAGLAVERAQVYRILEERIQERTKELKLQRDRLSTIFRSMGDGVALIDRERKIRYMNQRLIDEFGEAVDRKCYEVYTGRSEPCTFCPVEKIKDAGSVETVEVTAAKGRTLLITHTEIKNPDGNSSVLEILKDITERKKLEQQLLQSEKLASIGRLAAGVAHEINNPLANISMYAQILLEKARAENKKMLKIIKNQVDAAAGIVRNLLEFSHRQEMVLKPVNINEVVSKALTFLEHRFFSEKIEVVENLDPELPRVFGDENQLQQVFVNIILNALQAMPDGGRVTIASAGKGSCSEVRISDTGCGIPPENIPRIFDPFFTTKEVGRGTGLGLFISYGIIQKHGGRIYVESEVGKGTAFTVQLPAEVGDEGEGSNS